MSSIHYKFRSSVDYDTITFDGQAISLSDLRDAIMLQKKIAKSPAYTLEITNAQTKEVYETDETMVQKNSSVIVKRVPVQRLEAVTDQGSGLSKEEAQLTEMALAKLEKTADLVAAKASEDDKIKAMMRQSTEDFDPSTYQKRAPPNYTCYRCGGKGHFVRSCPTQGDPRYNKQQFSRQPSGIPREFMLLKMKQEKELLDSLRSMQPSNTNFSPVVSSEIVDHSKVPSELQCSICEKLFTDAVVTPCCGHSYCDECIRNHLVEHDLVCLCGETTSPDNLIANRSLRTSVSNFRNQKTAEMKSVPTSSIASSASRPARSVNGFKEVKEEPRSESPQFSNKMIESNNANFSVPSPTSTAAEPTMVASPQRVIDRRDISVSSVAAPIQPNLPLNVLPSNSLPVSVTPLPSHMIPGNVSGSIYTNVQPVLRPAYHHTVIGQPPSIIQQSAVVGSSIQYGLSIPHGATIVKRLVPVAVPGQRIITAQPGVPNHLRIAHVQQPEIVQQRTSVQVDLSQRLIPAAAPTVPQVSVNSGNRSKNPESPMPLTEDEFYKWQMKFKTRPSVRRRSRSKSPYRSGSRSPTSDKRKRRRHRSTSPNDSGKVRYDSPAEDSSQERKSKKKKDRLRKRTIRDSSQESLKGDIKAKSRSGVTNNEKKTKSGRRLPEHIKREVDEFDFDNELEFDEELRKLKSKSKNKKTGEIENNVEPKNLSSPKVEQSPSSESTADDDESHEVAAPQQSEILLGTRNEVKTKSLDLDNTKSKLTGNDVDEVGTPVNGSMAAETVDESVPNDAKAPMENTDDLNSEQPTEGEKPKRKTKIIKKKVIRVIKVSRKKSSSQNTTGENEVISQTVKHEHSSLENTDKNNSEDNTESPKKKSKSESTASTSGNRVSKRNVLSSLKQPDKKKELLRNRQLDHKRTEKAKQLFAEVRAKREAEKRELLQRTNKSNTMRNDTEVLKVQEAGNKLKESEEKKKKYERYIMLKKKAKEKALADRQRKAQKSAADTSKSETETVRKKSPVKKQSKVKLEQRSSDESSSDKKRPDQNFYKPGDTKLKTISELSKKKLQESDLQKSSSRSRDGKEIGDVLKSKVTSIKHIVISPEKRRAVRTSTSEDDADMKSSYSSADERRVVTSRDRKSSSKVVVSRVERPESRRTRNRPDVVEGKDSRHSRYHDDGEKRHNKEKTYEKERTREKEHDRKRNETRRLQLLEKEKDESIEREKYALKEKERLKRKLEREIQLRKQIERKHDDETKSERSRDAEKREKRKLKRDASECEDDDSERSTSKRSKKNKHASEVETPTESTDHVEKEHDSSTEEEERERKRKKKSKKKKDRKKKKKREEDSGGEESEEDTDDEDDEKKKKRKRKHKKKHKKRKSRKHKKKSKKKKKRQEKESESETSEQEEVTQEEGDQEEDEDNTEEEEESGSDSKSESANSSPVNDDETTEKTESESDEKEERHENTTTEKDCTDEDCDDNVIVGTKEKHNKSDDKGDENDDKAVESKKKLEDSSNAVKTSDSLTSTRATERKKRKSTLGDADDLELDYDDVDDVLDIDEEALLYGDLNFADDEQANPTSVHEVTNAKEEQEETEEGEIMDGELFTATTPTTSTSLSAGHSTAGKVESFEPMELGDIDDDTELDDVIDDAMNNIGLSSAPDSENETVTTFASNDNKSENR